MKHLNLNQTTSSIEVVSSTIIDKLYELAQTNLDETSNVQGNLQVVHAYEDAVAYLLDKFPNLQINVTQGAYIRFASAYAQSIFATNWGDGLGLSVPQAQAITNLNNKFQNLSTSFTLDEMKYMINLTWLRANEFYGCTGLTSINLINITFLDGPTGTTQGDYQGGAFKSCTNLVTVNNIDNITTINNNCFWDCEKLTTIKGTWHVSSIPIALFGRCNKLTGIVITSSCTTIKDSAFFNCNALVSLGDTSGLTVIEHNAFYNCTKLASIDTSNCTAIGSSSDQGGDYSASTFWGCRALTSLNLSKITIVQPGCFWRCTGLTSVTLSNSCTTIRDNAFQFCSSLTSVGDTSGVTSIGYHAFYECNSLVSLNLNGCNSIDTENVCYNCYNLTTLQLDNAISIYGGDRDFHGAFPYCSKLPSISLPKCTSIGGYAFYRALLMTTAYTPLCTSISDSAFEDCAKLTTINLDLVTTLGWGVFSGCSLLSTIGLLSSVTTMGGGVFRYCTNLAIDVNMPNLTSMTGTAQFAHSGIVKVSNLGSITSIADWNNGNGGGVFSNCPNLTKAILPSTITYVGSSSFQSDSSLVYLKVLATSVPTAGSGIL